MTASELIEFITAQRWFSAKAREVTQAQIVDEAVLQAGESEYAIALVEVRFAEGTHELYQLFRGSTSGDALGDPALARELVHRIRTGAPVQASEGAVEFHAVEGFAALGRELLEARIVGSEQSNSSVVFDDELILKTYRRLEAGTNPELEVLQFLTERGFPNIPALGGWYAYGGRPIDATLGIVQEFVAGAIDGWELALEELEHAPVAFLGRLHRLGQVVGAMHALLGADSADPTFGPEDPSLEALGLLTATVDEEIEQMFLDLPEDAEALEPIAGRGEEVREKLRALTHAASTGRIIRTHGDLHLGQTLWADGDWRIIDFEGEPARSLPERRRKRSALRDVAGLLRSLAYAASAVEILRGALAPDGWEERARREFLDGYLATVDPVLLPSDQEAIDKLLSVFELEKAVYELRYELNMRPDWLPIPVAGIARLLEEPVAS